MPDAGLPIFDKTVDETNAWLNEVSEATGASKQEAYHVLRAGLHALRDRMVPDEAVHLSQQLPLLVRGIYFEDWRPSDCPHKERSRDQFLQAVATHLTRDQSAVTPEAAVNAVFALLKAHCDAGELSHVSDQLPAEVDAMLKAA
jgi:uncharacterized protein (DUF2267 family)